MKEKDIEKLIKEIKDTIIYESIQEEPDREYINELIEILKDFEKGEIDFG